MENKIQDSKREDREYEIDKYLELMRKGYAPVQIDAVKGLKDFIASEISKAREEGKLEVLEELLEWDTPLEPIGKFMRLQTKMVHMKKDLISKLTTK